MTFEDKIVINASSEAIFKVYSDVITWNKWDEEVKESYLNGDFKVGSLGYLTPASGPTAKIKVVELSHEQLFTIESRLPFCTIQFEHVLKSSHDKTEVVHKVTFSGKLSRVFGYLIGRNINKGLPKTLQGLKLRVESLNV